MNANHIQSKFAMLGARLKISVAPKQRDASDYAVDIQEDGQGEFFELRVPEALRNRLDLSVLQADKSDRHLLLYVRAPEGSWHLVLSNTETQTETMRNVAFID